MVIPISPMEQSFSFGNESFDAHDRMDLILQGIDNLIENVSRLVGKIEELLQTHKSLSPIMGFNRNNNIQITKNIDIIRNTIEQPSISGLHEIAGLKSIKTALQTLIVLPRQQPQLFQNRTVSNSILLYGPPGTGKTRLVHGLAAESGAILHPISVSDLLSSYVGGTEKNIKDIFLYLRENKEFSILFIDEIDGLCRKRCSSENEYSRRIKTELMCQMNKTVNNENIVIVAATNCPWDLDSAILRRFQKRIYVPLPNSEERLELLQHYTKDIEIVSTPKEAEELIEISEGFSGSDIAGLVQDALDIPLTELQNTTIWTKTAEGFYEPFKNENLVINIENIFILKELKDLPAFSVKARPVTLSDFLEAAKQVQVTVKAEDLEKYEKFNGK